MHQCHTVGDNSTVAPIRVCTFMLVLCLMSGVMVQAPPQPLAHAQEPHEDLIAYRGRDGNLWLMKSDGTDQRMLVSVGEMVVHITWFPDGSRMMFTTYSHKRWYTINADGSGLASRPFDNVDWISFSPDGTRLVGQLQVDRVTDRGTALVTMDIVVESVDGTNRVSVTGCSPARPCSVSTPAWSPDGQWIAFIGYEGIFKSTPRQNLLAIRPDGTGEKTIASPMGTQFPAWSPDGMRVAVAVNKGGAGYGVSVLNANSAAAVEMPLLATGQDRPSWSPDGLRLAIGAYESGTPRSAKVYVVNADGSHPVELGLGDTPAWQPRPRATLSPSLLTEKQASIGYLSNLKLDFLAMDVAALPLPAWRSFNETRAQALVSQLKAKSDAGTLTRAEASAFLRLTLVERAAKSVYKGYAQTADDISGSVVDMVSVTFSLMNVIDQCEKVLRSVPIVGEEVTKLLDRARELAFDCVNDFVHFVSASIPDPDLQDGVRRSTKLITEYYKLEMSQGKSVLDVLKEGVAQAFGDGELIGAFVLGVQPAIDDAVDKAAEPESSVRGTDADAEAAVSGVIARAERSAEDSHGVRELMKTKTDLPNTISALADIGSVVASPTGMGFLIGQAISIAAKSVSASLSAASGWVSFTLLKQMPQAVYDADLVAFDPAAKLQSSSGVGASGEATARPAGQVQVSYVAASASNGALSSGDFLEMQRSRLQNAADQYRVVLDKVVAAAEKGDQDALRRLVPDLLAAEEALSGEFKGSNAPLLGAANRVKDASFVRQLGAAAAASADLKLQNIALYGALMDNLLNPQDTAARARTRDQAGATLQSIAASQAAIDAAVLRLTGVQIASLVVVSAHELSETPQPGRDFVLSVKLANAGAVPAENVLVSVTGGRVVPADDSRSVATIPAGGKTTVRFTFKPATTGTEILTLTLVAEGALVSTEMFYIQVPEATATKLVNGDTLPGFLLPVLLGGLASTVTATIVFLAILRRKQR